MSIIVQKFGGSSMADPARIRHCAGRAAEATKRDGGSSVAVVVSAMGDTTDDLLALAGNLSEAPDKREIDQLLSTGEQVSTALMAIALQSMGIPAISLTGAQAGIQTDPIHTRARIRSIDPARLEAEFARGKIPVVAGFQGAREDTVGPGCAEVTTLGRGGSDTTAVALAAALKADVCEIYTDVDGVYTADPRIVPHARLLETISYDEMMEAASQGAKVMHLRAVELGKKEGVPIRVLHSMRHGPGTLICDARQSDTMETKQAVTAVALKTDIGRVTLTALPNRAGGGIQREIFDRIAAAGISVDDIIQTEDAADPDRCTIVFTMDKTDLAEVRPIIETVLKAVGGGKHTEDLGLCKVSAVGVGMQSQPGVAARMFAALAEAEGGGIRIANITTSEIKISCILDEADGKRALRVVHDAFGLSNPPVIKTTGGGASAGRTGAAKR